MFHPEACQRAENLSISAPSLTFSLPSMPSLFKPFFPQLLPPSLQDKVSLHGRSPPFSRKSWAPESLMWRHCMSESCRPLPSICYQSCIQLPHPSPAGLGQVTSLPGLHTLRSLHHLPHLTKPFHSLFKINSYSL